MVEAVQRQATELLHYSASDFYLPIYSEVCERLDAIAPFGGATARSFLTNSGTEAVEAAIKLARYATGRQYLIGFYQSFHGRSMGSVTLTASKAKYRTNFGPMLPSVYHSFYGDFDYLEEVLFSADRLADRGRRDRRGVLARRGRVRPAARGLVPLPARALRPARDPARLRRGAVRHGPQRHDGGRSSRRASTPDIVTAGKGIASGLPLGAMIAREDLMVWELGAHGSTYGGSPVSCAAALATFDVIEQEGLMANAIVGRRRAAGAGSREIASRHPLITDVRGRALWIGLAFADHDAGRRGGARARSARAC